MTRVPRVTRVLRVPWVLRVTRVLRVPRVTCSEFTTETDYIPKKFTKNRSS